MSRKNTGYNLRHKDRVVDEGCVGPDDPIYSEGWTFGPPLGASSLFKLTTPSQRKATAEAKRAKRRSKR